MKLIRAELFKIRTTSTWWILALVTVPLWALTLFFNWLQTETLLDAELVGELSAMEGNEALAVAAQLENVAANLYTNGQFFGLLMVMVLGILVITSEFFHQTVTTTFLTTPHRTAVSLAKLGAAAILGVFFWLATTLLNFAVTLPILSSYGVDSQLDSGAIWQAIALNGLAYLLWAIFGVGIGILVRSQLGATVTAIVVYLGGYIGAGTAIILLATRYGDWINNLQVLIPPLASQLMVTGTDLPGNPARWVGAVVLIGYAVVTGAVGTALLRKRDIS
ncbi:ABC transporter permease [Melissospora conviva]|uniref:ABC transporter permease n=1 Tax=Melissospora conviva TaxID=3388432 RepID=UPI003C2215BF